MRTLALLLILLLLPFSSYGDNSTTTNKSDVKLLIIVQNSDSPLNVYFSTDGDIARGLLLLGPLINGAIIEKRNSRFIESLTQSVGSYDRHEIISSSIKSAFESKYPVFDVSLAEKTSLTIKS